MALTGVLRPGHVSLRVLELEPALKHYKDVMGLIETDRDAQGRVFLKAWDEHDHHSVVLREADEAGMDYMGWKVDSEPPSGSWPPTSKPPACATDLAWIPAGEHPGTGERFRFTIPTGHVMELYADKARLGNNCGTDGPDINPNPWPDGLKGISPSRFDHCLLYGDDLDGTVKLFTEVLGFGITEKVMAG
jgi:catechol 2,3-dioxygenase